MSIAWCRDSEVLGSKNDDDGESLTTVHAQLLNAQGAFFSKAAVLLCPFVCLAKKFRHYIKFVVPVAFMGVDAGQ